MNFFEPKYLNKLKAQIYLSGHRTMKEFADKVGIPNTQLSKIISGHEIPTQVVARSIMDNLELSPEQFSELF